MSQERPQESISEVPKFTLSELNNAIKSSLELSFPESIWLVAEISELRCDSKGHCYLGLVEKKDANIIAQMKANIWTYAYRTISHKFQKVSGESLKDGMKVLLLATVTFHEKYGISLNIKDIDPSYSLGEMARKKREVIERLTKEGIIDNNKQFLLPIVPQRIAVVSSSSAAGYGDFINHIESNSFGYKVQHDLYQSIMQGQDAEASIISSLNQIRENIGRYDLVVIIRGGGSKVDLHCFDSYCLALEITRFPLPVITGIGHERDDTVIDIVAHTRMKTPTAVAEFVINGMRSFEENIIDLQRRLTLRTRVVLEGEKQRLRIIIQGFAQLITARFHDEDIRLHSTVNRLMTETNRVIGINNSKVAINATRLNSAVKTLFNIKDNRIKTLEQAIGYLDPVNVLKRGYSITYLNGQPLKDVDKLAKGDIIQTKLYNGSATSKVEGFDGNK